MKDSNLIWIDLEMTGLDTQTDYILEIATLITDSELNTIAEGPNLAIYQDEEVLAMMNEWNIKQHTKSGLVARVRVSSVSTSDAQSQTLEFVKKYVEPQASPMCGNTICQDRRFLARLMPDLERYFHYRQLDVSTVKELAKRWAPSIYKSMIKESGHLAMGDIKESIEELKYYRDNFFKILEK